MFFCFFFVFFLPYMGMVVILFKGAELFKETVNTPLSEGLM